MSATAKVSRYIPDIAPTLTLRRDKAYSTYPANRRRYALPSMEVIREIEPNYAWNCLPNMSAYKTAIVRNKVCEGLMYLLPGDKNSTSLARPYTAELGAMFNEPYHNFKPDEYNEENVKQSSSVHFSPSTHKTRLSKHFPIRRLPHSLNTESKQAYNDYNALVLRSNQQMTGGASKGNLLEPVKVGEAELELQKEVQLLLDDVDIHGALEEKEDSEEKLYSSMLNSSASHRASSNPHNNHKSIRFSSTSNPVLQPDAGTSHGSPQKVQDFRQHYYHKKSAKFRDYKELREAEVPRPKLPEQLKTQYLSDQKTAEIWEWLHWDYKKSKLEHFIEVCS